MKKKTIKIVMKLSETVAREIDVTGQPNDVIEAVVAGLRHGVDSRLYYLDTSDLFLSAGSGE